MWYLITFEADDLVKVSSEQEPTNFEFQGKEEGTPVFNVREGAKNYEMELITDFPDASRLSDLNALNPRGFILLNHAAVLLKWKGDFNDLENKIKTIFTTNDKYAIIAVGEIKATNFLDKDLANFMLKR
ncbi:MAG: hypothetical protein EA412_02745 [Chitinophagaceae bacterium]|nr:MAG: hypothetical protein EA412_02745 [Chitinophagaceae bacterium]